MKKRLIGSLTALVIALSLVPGARANSRVFWDVRRGDWFAGYVYALAERDIVNGMTAETFAPSGEVTRAQLLKLMAAGAAAPEALETARGAARFSDVAADAWYAPYVNWCAQQGVAEGYPDGTFLPDAQVTRAEAAAFVTRFAKACADVTLKDTAQPAAFTDAAAIPAWARDAIDVCVRAGVFQGYPDGSYRPAAHMTRAEAAAILSRLLDIALVPDSSIPNASQPESLHRTVEGVVVDALILPASGYTGRIVLAQDRLFGAETGDRIFARTDAYLAANGAFFDLGDRTTYANLVVDGEPVRIDNTIPAAAPSLVIDGAGKVSIAFPRLEQTLTRARGSETLGTAEHAARNRVPYDPDGSAKETVVYTAVYGETVPAGFARAAVVDADGTITAVYDAATGTDAIAIPETGFVVAEHGDGAALLEGCAPGDRIDCAVVYAGAPTQDVRALMSCGPTLVKNGAPYGDRDTYAAEGFTAWDLASASAVRMAVGVRADGSVVLATAKCTMAELSQIMAALGCQTAMNLDGGSSSYLRAGETVLRTTTRALNTMLVFAFQ